MSDTDHIAPELPVRAAKLVETLADGTKVKVRTPRMRACDERDEKNKICAGHLKRWYTFGGDIAQRFGQEAELYRCEHCKTIYLPNPEETPRSGTLAY